MTRINYYKKNKLILTALVPEGSDNSERLSPITGWDWDYYMLREIKCYKRIPRKTKKTRLAKGISRELVKYYGEAQNPVALSCPYFY